MRRWLVLSQTLVVLSGFAAGLAAGLVVKLFGAGTLAIGIVLGGAVAALVGATVSMIQRSLGHATVDYLEETERRAVLDPLTGLLNRSGLMEAVVEALRRGRADSTCVGVLFSDLDRFKVVNDSLGHEAGDRLLEAVAARLSESVRTADVVARFGGDEFVVVCHGLLEADSILRVAEVVREAFVAPFAVNGGELVIVPSIGVAVWDPADGETVSAEEMVRDADAAMYQAKRSRRGISVFDNEVRQHLVSRLQIEQALNAGIETEIVVHYQPVVDASTHRLVGMEALARWFHPELGLLYPADFLAIAEEAGLIARLGDVVLRESCAQAAHWNHIDPACRDMEISVNVAEHQLLDAGFPARVAEVLEWADLPATQLCLEISEDLVTDHLEGSLPVLQHIADQGVKLSLDDFGTGRTTLSHLKRLNDVVHQVKIDRAFVTHLPDDPVDQAVVEAVSRIAGVANLVIVAEGVETQAQADALLALGIAHHQGFLYSKSLPATRVVDLFTRPPVTAEIEPIAIGSFAPA